MWVRIARFEGADPDTWDHRIEQIKQRITGGGDGGERRPIKRAVVLADHKSGRGANLMFCDSEEDVRRADEYMNRMTPPTGAGSRRSAEIYEVVVDEELS
jgi:hypothetical protein